MKAPEPAGPNRGASPSFETRSADWIGVGDALSRILAGSAPLEAEEVGLVDALGRVLASDVTARATLPPRDNSAMDGYAVRARDTAGADADAPVRLTVTGRVHAGELPERPLAPGEAIRIMTGAPLPAGADAIVRVEDTDRETGRAGEVAVRTPVEAGRHVRPAGEDLRAGDVPLRAGRRITPGVIALASALGRGRLAVHRRPTVAILTTGSELRDASGYDDVIAGRGIPESNGPMLAAMARGAGAEPLLLPLAADEPAVLADRFRAAAGADALVTVGGASMGEADLVKRVLDDLGFRQDFWRVRVRPGSPFGFGRLPRGSRMQPVFGLPGNPSSAFVTFEVFVRPYLRALAGRGAAAPRPVRCIAGEELRGPEHLTVYLRVRTDPDEPGRGRPRVWLTGPQGSGLVRGLAEAEGLAVLPEGTGRIARGGDVEVLRVESAWPERLAGREDG